MSLDSEGRRRIEEYEAAAASNSIMARIPFADLGQSRHHTATVSGFVIQTESHQSSK